MATPPGSKSFPTDYSPIIPGPGVNLLADDGVSTGLLPVSALLGLLPTPAFLTTTNGVISLGVANGNPNIALTPASLAAANVAWGSGITMTLGSVAQAATSALPGATAVSVQALPYSALPTVSISIIKGVSTFSFGLPAAVPGPVTYLAFNPTDNFNPATSVTSHGVTLSSSTVAPGAQYVASSAGTSSLTGSLVAFAQNDILVANAAGTAWLRQSNQTGATSQLALVLPNLISPSYTVLDNGTADGVWAITDPYGQVVFQAGPGGVAGGVATFNTLSTGTLTASGSASISGSLSVGGFSIQDNGDGLGNQYFTDSAGNIGAQITPLGFAAYAATFGVATINTLTVLGGLTAPSLTTTGSLAIGSSCKMTDNGDSLGAIYFTDGQNNIGAKIDAAGISAGNGTFTNLTVLGALSAPALSGGSVFLPSEIAAYDTANAMLPQATRAAGNSTAQRPVSNYNLHLGGGQSKGVGEQGSPAFSTTQPLDSLMVGLDTRPVALAFNANASTVGTFTPVGDSNFHPLVSTSRLITVSMAIYTQRTGGFSSIGSVTVTAGSSNGTISWPGGPDATTVLAIGDTFQVAGFTGASSANNAQTSTDNTFTVTGVLPGSIVVAEVPIATTAPQSGISLYQASYLNFGEDINVSAINEFRKQQLDQRGLALDPSRVMVVNNGGVPGQTIASLSKGANPDLYGRSWRTGTSPGIANIVQAKAAALGSTSCISSIYFSQGGSDASGGTSIETYMASYQTLVQNMTADAKTVFGQKNPPFWFAPIIGGLQLTDFDASGTEPCPIPMAQLRLFGCAPSIGANKPFTPDMYLIGPDYHVPDHGAHSTGNGYLWAGAMVAKVMNRVITYGQGWKPLHCVSALLRGSQVLVNMHVPCPPIQIQQPFNHQQTTLYPDLGFTVLDTYNGVPFSIVPIISATIVSSTEVLLQLTRSPNLASCLVRYADNSHKGNGNLCDSDSATSLSVWAYTPGSGQLLSENFPNSPTQSQPVQNGVSFPLWNWLCPFALPTAAA